MTLGSPRPAVAPEHDGREHGCGREQAGVGLVDHAAHQVALRDVRRLVREHARELVLVGGREEQAAVDHDESARHREGVDDRIAHHGVVELMLSLLGAAREAVAELLDVVGDLRVLEHDPLRAHLPRPRLADLELLLQRHGGGGRTAEIGQVLLLLRGCRIRRPADAHARGGRKCGDREEGGERFQQLHSCP